MQIFRSIKGKLLLFSIVLFLVPTVVVGVVSYAQAKTNLNTVGEQVIQNSVYRTLQQMEQLNEQIESGNMTQEAAEDYMKEHVIGPMQSDGTRTLSNDEDLGEHGYIYFLQPDGTLAGHLNREGESLWNEQDSNGNYFIRDVVEVASAGGFTYYDFALPTGDGEGTKLTYAKTFEPWGWIVASGSYMTDFNAPANALLTTLAITVAVTSLICIGAVLLFSRHIASPLQQLAAHARAISAGNLTISFEQTARHDEVGTLTRHFDTMVQQLKMLIGGVHTTTAMIQDASSSLLAVAEETNAYGEDVLHAASEVATGTLKQAEQFDETRQMTKALVAQIDTLAAQHDIVAHNAQMMQSASFEGRQNVGQLQEMSTATVTQTHAMEETLHELQQKVVQVDSIVNNITAIADQTNLLALNASIEAARAGEHGKGFAVVAEEVRKLADETNVATQRAQQTLQSITAHTDTASLTMRETVAIVQQQQHAVHVTGHSFEQVEEALQHVSSAMHEMSITVETLHSTQRSFSVAIHDIAEISDRHTSMVQEVTASVEEQQKAVSIITTAANDLTDDISGLQQAVAHFQTV